MKVNRNKLMMFIGLLLMSIALFMLPTNSGRQKGLQTKHADGSAVEALYIAADMPPCTVVFRDSKIDTYRYAIFSFEGHPNRDYVFSYPTLETRQIKYRFEKVDDLVDEENPNEDNTTFTFTSNVSLVRLCGRNYICSAIHCVEDLDIPFVAVGYDIAVSQDTSFVYKLDSIGKVFWPAFMDDFIDSIFIQGYYFPGEDPSSFTSVAISGLAWRNNINMSNCAVVPLEKHYDFHGISGSPAFNSKGQIIGVVAEQEILYTKTDTASFLIVSLFTKP